jgi:hypothetical protein
VVFRAATRWLSWSVADYVEGSQLFPEAQKLEIYLSEYQGKFMEYKVRKNMLLF